MENIRKNKLGLANDNLIKAKSYFESEEIPQVKAFLHLTIAAFYYKVAVFSREAAKLFPRVTWNLERSLDIFSNESDESFHIEVIMGNWWLILAKSRLLFHENNVYDKKGDFLPSEEEIKMTRELCCNFDKLILSKPIPKFLDAPMKENLAHVETQLSMLNCKYGVSKIGMNNSIFFF
jgi:hypothetical protein